MPFSKALATSVHMLHVTNGSKEQQVLLRFYFIFLMQINRPAFSWEMGKPSVIFVTVQFLTKNLLMHAFMHTLHNKFVSQRILILWHYFAKHLVCTGLQGRRKSPKNVFRNYILITTNNQHVMLHFVMPFTQQCLSVVEYAHVHSSTMCTLLCPVRWKSLCVQRHPPVDLLTMMLQSAALSRDDLGDSP